MRVSVDKCSGDRCICNELKSAQIVLEEVRLYDVSLISRPLTHDEVVETMKFETTRERVFREREEYMAASARIAEAKFNRRKHG